MKTASIHDLKQELSSIPQKQLLELCLRLAKYKKENKELLNYLLFEAYDEHGYIEKVKQEVDDLFTNISVTNVYLAKKGIRKIIRYIAKYSRYTGSKQSELELLIHFCIRLKSLTIFKRSNIAIRNIYSHQLKKINKLIPTLEEDLQYDYNKQLATIAIGIQL